MRNPVHVVRFGELKPCRTAFIDAHTPGSDQKENFTIIGGGVSESADQHVHLSDQIGFNIGAAGQPPKCNNSLHTHRTAEVFFVLKGRWRFFWGQHGSAGEVILNEGDIFNIPTPVFRGFENVGDDYGMIMAVLGGDDAGGGVVWAPHVLAAAEAHGLVLGDNGRLYDRQLDETLPPGVAPITPLTEQQLTAFPELPNAAVVPHYVKRYWDLMALSDHQPCPVIGAGALIHDRPGFEVDFVSRGSLTSAYQSDRPEVLMGMRGHWKLTVDGTDTLINPGDTVLVDAGASRTLVPAVSGEASLYRVRPTEDPAGPTLGF
ncbi:cupin domain-containing protein [Litorivicinus lipolyticus]|uniref:Cupin domain-containing protein n=1 Tax=Litorivicinus lipolyticus TaxID=418701 RepID=A0A5Q2Q623_9GAMM|nr:cupin domain-containing protein [Litorivicinus lipolyticus]QGG79579.1 cupin domain-containing protein [Litorivicinus lipolyticus]